MSSGLEEHIIAKGRYKGRKLDNRTRRSIKIIEETDIFFIVDYFFHEGEFFTAKIPKNSLKEVIGQRFNFSRFNPFINHAQVRLKLQDGKNIELYALGTLEECLHKINDFVYSIEVVGPQGKTWSLIDSFGDFISAHRMLSIEEVVFERLSLGGYKVRQSPPLLFTQSQLDEILILSLKRAHRASRMNERYYLISIILGARNCTSEMFKIIDKIKKEEYTLIQKVLAKFFWRLPFALKFYINLRGVVDYSHPRQNLNDEFSNLAQSEKHQVRINNIRSKGIRIDV